MAVSKLKGNWGNAIILCMLFISMHLLTFLCHISNHVTYKVLGFDKFTVGKHSLTFYTHLFLWILHFASGIVYIMAYYTLTRQYIDISRGRYFNHTRNAIMVNKKHFFKVSVLPSFLKILIILCCVIPGIFGIDSVRRLSLLSMESRTLSVLTLLFFMMSVLMIIVSFFLTFNSILCLHLLRPLIMLNPMMPVKDAIAMCFRKANGNRLRIVWFYLGFARFLPLVILIYPIFLLLPYYTMSNLVLCEDILGKELSEDHFEKVFEVDSTDKEQD